MTQPLDQQHTGTTIRHKFEALTLSLGRPLIQLEPFLLLMAIALLLFPNHLAPAALPLLLLPWAGRLLAQHRLTQHTPLNLPALLLLLMTLAGYLVAPDRAMSWAKLWGMVLHIALFFVLINQLGSRFDARQAVLLILPLTAAVTVLSLVGADWTSVRILSFAPLYDYLPQLTLALPGSGVPRSTSLFHPREVGATMAMLLPATLGIFLWHRRLWARLAAAAITLLAATLLLLTQALSALLGLALALTFIAIYWRRWLLLPLLLGLLATAAAILLYGPSRLALLLLDMQNLLGVGFILRLDMWSRALAMIGDMPLTGIGLNNFPVVQSHFYTGYLIGPEVHAHNLFLQTALDFGLPGLLAFLWLLVAFYHYILRAARRVVDRTAQMQLIALAACPLAYLGNGLLDVFTLGAKPLLALWLIIGLTFALARSLSPPLPQTATTRLRWQIGLPAFLLLATLLVLPAATLYGNLGAVQAQRLLWQARHTGQLSQVDAQQAIAALNQAIALGSDSPQLHNFLGSLHAWSGDNEAAITALRQRVSLDGPDALPAYAPFVAWQRQLAGDPPPAPWHSTARLYTHWQTRFPQRAETHLLLAILHNEKRDDPNTAASLLQRAIDQATQPHSLITYYQTQLPTTP